MTDKKMLVGSLSNDLYRVASLIQRGSDKAAQRFFEESRKWSDELLKQDIKQYIKDIINDLQGDNFSELTLDNAEDILMYSILLQNYSLKL